MSFTEGSKYQEQNEDFAGRLERARDEERRKRRAEALAIGNAISGPGLGTGLYSANASHVYAESTTKQGEIPREVERQEKTLAELGDAIAGLRHRLAPVLEDRPAPVLDRTIDRVAPGSHPVTPIGASLADNTDRIGALTASLRELYHSIGL
jgi:hypothetical protein